MTFFTRVDASAFDPDSIRILSDAFEEAWQSLQSTGATFHLDDQAEQTREILARCIIESAKLGERDCSRLRDAALVHHFFPRLAKLLLSEQAECSPAIFATISQPIKARNGAGRHTLAE